MYYVLQKDHSLVGKYAHFQDEPKGFSTSDWITGKRLLAKPPVFEIVTDRKHKSTKLSDLLLTRYRLMIVSTQLRECLADTSADVEYFPIRVREHSSATIDESYWAANITCRVACLDRENSEIDLFDDEDDDIQDLTKFNLKEDLVGDAKLFVLDEFPFVVIATEAIKQAVEAHGLVGLKFVETTRYTGF